MSDLISRQDAIRALQELEMLKDVRTWDGWNPIDYVMRMFLEAEDVIKAIPSAKQKGRWQRRKGSDCWECSKCHAVLESDDIVRHNFYYCYHCGADMMNEDGYMKLEGTDHE